ncbi:MAG: hypothetical protein BECKG1743D_GA0114223_109432 [Candidatus Kentron sp. G]|nr:MAG: hypothetical protein BECKG1743D_GA0114223_100137 [Candidatus Kentron sp. G]VFN04393.1 MAG: hypothetical protein BECKG1743E_GA0114224_107223 [Candidatus Kentron sp. G]VFN05144.1 MAG: hypothetical protein BECKG1743F_GA0114225_110321 [Candidatus Kentron sp. G]VFN06950.1 MAG: hypothetical protein BECKG1743D_GA0114223_109432 [Candidatus Kentron sp. G]
MSILSEFLPRVRGCKATFAYSPTGNNLPTLLAYSLQIFVRLVCCNDSYIVHYAPVIAP